MQNISHINTKINKIDSSIDKLMTILNNKSKPAAPVQNIQNIIQVNMNDPTAQKTPTNNVFSYINGMKAS